MTDDLRRRAAELMMQKVQSSRDKWAPGAWQAAAAYNATKPEVRCPVVLGGDSMFQTPEDLSNFRQLPQVPAVIKTVRSTLLDKAPEPLHEDNMVQVMDVSQREFIELTKRTQGKAILVWFGGKSRYAWVPWSANPESSPASSAETRPVPRVSPAPSVITEKASSNAPAVGQQEQSPLRQQPAPESKEAASPANNTPVAEGQEPKEATAATKPADFQPEATSSPPDEIQQKPQQDPVSAADSSVAATVDGGGGDGGKALEKEEGQEGGADKEMGEADAPTAGEDLTTAEAAVEVVEGTGSMDVTGVGDTTEAGDVTEAVETEVATVGAPSPAAKSA